MDENINIYRSQVVANTFHFFVAGAKASFYPFLTFFLRYIGLTATQTGIVIGVKAFAPLISTPIWLFCASKCQRRRCVLMTSIFVVMISVLMLSIIPADNNNEDDFCLPNINGNMNGTENPYLTSTLSPTESIVGSTTSGKITNGGNETALDVNEPSATTKTSVTTKTSTTTAAPLTTTISGTTSTKIITTPKEKTTTTPSETPQAKSTPMASNIVDVAKDQDMADLYNALLALPPEKLKEIGLDKDLSELSPDEVSTLLQNIMSALDKTSVSPVTTEGSVENNGVFAGLSKEEIQILIDKGITPELLENLDENKLVEFLDKISVTNPKTRHKRNVLSSFLDSLNDGLSDLQENVAGVKNATFITVLCIVLFGELFSCSIEKLADKMWFDFTDGIDMLEKYGPHRSWIILGWIFLPIIVSGLVDTTDCFIFSHTYHYNIHFYVFGGLMGLSFIWSFMFPMLKEKKKVHRHTSLWKGLKILCGDVRGFSYCVCLLVLGLCSAGIDNFLMWRIQDMGGTEVILGGAISLGAFTSLIIHILLRWIVYKITNAGAIILALFALAIRLILYAYMWAPWVVLAVGFLQAFSHTLLLGTIETYPDFKVNPYIMDRSAKSVATGLYMGFAYSFGSVISGLVYDTVGLTLLYQASAILAVSWCVLFALIQKCTKRNKKMRYARLLQAEEDQMTDSSDDDEDDWLQSALKHEK